MKPLSKRPISATPFIRDDALPDRKRGCVNVCERRLEERGEERRGSPRCFIARANVTMLHVCRMWFVGIEAERLAPVLFASSCSVPCQRHSRRITRRLANQRRPMSSSLFYSRRGKSLARIRTLPLLLLAAVIGGVTAVRSSARL